MTNDPIPGRMNRLEVRMDNMSRALASHASITEELRAAHNHSLRIISDAIHRSESLDLGALLASMEHDSERPD